MSARKTSSTLDRRTLLRGSITIAGVAVVLPGMASLAGCNAAPPAIKNQMALLSALSDRIIPETSTGGAVAAKVPDYIAAVFDAHFTEDQQNDFAVGLTVYDERAQEDGARDFASASAEQQDALLTGIESDASGSWAKAHFGQIRDMVIFGYYTSEVASEELAYEEYPGRFDGCVPLAEIGAAWLDRGV